MSADPPRTNKYLLSFLHFMFGNYEEHCRVSNCYMQTLKYMLKIILLTDYYTINYLLMLCNNFILFVLYKGGSHASDMYMS